MILRTIAIEMFGPVGPKIGPTGSTISIVLVIGPDSADPRLFVAAVWQAFYILVFLA